MRASSVLEIRMVQSQKHKKSLLQCHDFCHANNIVSAMLRCHDNLRLDITFTSILYSYNIPLERYIVVYRISVAIKRDNALIYSTSTSYMLATVHVQLCQWCHPLRETTLVPLTAAFLYTPFE